MLIKIVPTREVSKLLKTGQTTSYVDYDDGYYEKGVAKEYLVLTTGQFSLTTDITLNGKTDAHSNNCVLDVKTGLMWSRYVSASVGPGSVGKLPWTTNVNGEGIFPYCAAANAGNLSGYNDWRIPNIAELVTIQNYDATGYYPNPTAFPGYPATDTILSGTTAPHATGNVLTIRESGGYEGEMERYAKTENHYVHLVRGGN